MKFTTRKFAKGFTLVELIIVITIIAVLALYAIPKIRAHIISGNVSKTGDDMSAVVGKIRSNSVGSGSTPYGGIDTSVFANLARNATTLNVTGTGTAATVTHELGASNAPIEVAPSTITVANDSYTATMSQVHDAGCGIGAQLGKSAEIVTLNGTTVKAAANAPYNGSLASTSCTSGEGNTFVFTFR